MNVYANSNIYDLLKNLDLLGWLTIAVKAIISPGEKQSILGSHCVLHLFSAIQVKMDSGTNELVREEVPNPLETEKRPIKMQMIWIGSI